MKDPMDELDSWQPPNEYPYRDTAPGRCFLWHHPKVLVRALAIKGHLIERYDCQCGKWYWLSGPNGRGRAVRFRNMRSGIAPDPYTQSRR